MKKERDFTQENLDLYNRYSDSEQREAFLLGCCVGAAAAGDDRLTFALRQASQSEQYNLIRDALQERDAEEKARTMRVANSIIGVLDTDPQQDAMACAALRSMLCQAYSVGEDGTCYDSQGRPMTDRLHQVLTDKRSPWQDWEAVQYEHRDTGELIESDAYNKLSSEKKSDYELVRMMYITDPKGQPIYIYEHDRPTVAALARRDILQHPGLAELYATSIGAGNTSSEPGKMAPIRDDVIIALHDTGLPEYQHQTIINMLGAGKINAVQHLWLAVMDNLPDIIGSSTPDNLKNRLDYYVELAKQFTASNTELTKVFSSSILDQYTNDADEMLYGYDGTDIITDPNKITTDGNLRYIRYIGERAIGLLFNAVRKYAEATDPAFIELAKLFGSIN